MRRFGLDEANIAPSFSRHLAFAPSDTPSGDQPFDPARTAQHRGCPRTAPTWTLRRIEVEAGGRRTHALAHSLPCHTPYSAIIYVNFASVVTEGRGRCPRPTALPLSVTHHSRLLPTAMAMGFWI